MAKSMIKLTVTKKGGIDVNEDSIERTQYFQSAKIHDMVQPVPGGANFRYTPEYAAHAIDYEVTENASDIHVTVNS